MVYWCKKIPLPELVSMNIQSKLLLMFLVAFIALFAGNEIRTGFIKNIAGQTRHRWEFVIGKLLSIAIFTAVLLVAAILAIMAGSVLFFFWICSYSGGRKIHRVFRDAISTSYCLWQRDPVPCLPISKCGSKPVDRDFAGGRNFTGCGCVADKHYSPSKRDCRL